ncbi:hypothetical protein [Leptospira congkakensis]|nr:hypothetical protein [Leptospira congkakensis]TGL98777.1 hypothetical protein EHQ70_04230 [Leptospira congkakensis]
MNQTSRNLILTILSFVVLMTLWNCHTEYTNAPEICALLVADDQSLLQKDLDSLNRGDITQEQFELRKRNRENGSLGICLIALIKTKENSNF